MIRQRLTSLTLNFVYDSIRKVKELIFYMYMHILIKILLAYGRRISRLMKFV